MRGRLLDEIARAAGPSIRPSVDDLNDRLGCACTRVLVRITVCAPKMVIKQNILKKPLASRQGTPIHGKLIYLILSSSDLVGSFEAFTLV